MKPANQVDDRLLAEAKQLPTPGQRRAFLQAACGENLQLRQRLEAALGDACQAGETDDSCAVVSTCTDASPPALPATTKKSGDRIGHYVVIRRQGAGGMGEVYLAQDTRLGRLVALKFLPEEAARDAARRLRFFSEARAAASLDHPNICTVYDVAETDDALPYIAMEWLEGPTLQERLTAAPLSLAELLPIGLQITEALEAAHARGIVHRDLKPANVSLMSGGLVKVLDFGLAKWQELALPDDALPAASLAESGHDDGAGATTASQTAAGLVVGSLGYMSPEQAAGKPVDHRSDLFSLGVVLYEMATGRLPFAGGTRAEILQRTIAGEPESLARFNDRVPAELERIVTKCLRKHPGERYQSAREVHADLMEFRARLTATGGPVPGQVITLLCAEVPEAASLKQAGRLQDAAELMRQQEASFQKLVNGQARIEATAHAFLMEFGRASEAVQAALRMILETGATCRFGIHFGEVLEPQQADPRRRYAVHFETVVGLARLAGPGHVLMSRGVFDNARVMIKRVDAVGLGALSWLSHGQYAFAGLEEPLEVCEVVFAGPSSPSPPPTTDYAQRLTATAGDTVLGWRPAVGQEVPNTKWVLEEKLGEGGFGEVWKARHAKLEEFRVFKFCFRADRVRSLKREVTLFRVLKERIGDHPNIVKLYDIYFDQPPFYLEEEYVEGRDLRWWCEAQGGVEKVPLAVRLEMVSQAADALQAAHDAGVIHRDVKPGNILISSQLLVAPQSNEGGLVAPKSTEGGPVSPKLDEGGSTPPSRRPNHQPPVRHSAPDEGGSTINYQPLVKLTDFGIGQVTSEEVLKDITCSGLIQTLLSPGSSHTGTQLYLAPELLAGKPATTRSDIYSLGVVLYQFLVGDFRKPLTADWARGIEDALLRDDLEHCLAGTPDERFAAAGLLANQLRNYRNRQEAALKEQRQQRATARRRRFLIASGIATAALLTIAASLGYGLWQARQERDRAQAIAYTSDIYLASRELQQYRIHVARSLLDQNRPDPKKREGPGWEWRYLWGQVQGDELYTLGEPVRESSMVLRSGERVLRVAGTAEDTGIVELWDLQSRQLLAAHTMERRCTDIAISSSCQVIAVATYGPICLLDPIDLRPKSMLELSQTVNNLEISPDGKWLAGSTANYLAIVDLDRLTQVCWTNTGAERLHDIAFSPDSQFVVSPGPGGRVVLWRTADLSLVRYLGKPKGMGNIADLAFSVDGRSVFVSAGHSLERLNAETGSIEAALDLGFGGSTTLAVSPDGSTVAWAALGARLHLCDSVTLELKRYLQGHQAGADTILFSAQGDRLISCARDGIKVWDPAKPGAPRGFQTKEVGPNSAISPNGRFVAWIRPGSDLADLTDIARWQNVARFSLPTNVSIQAVSAAGDWVAASDVVGTVYSIATATSRMVKHLSIRETGPPSLVRFAPSGDNFLTAAPTRDKQILMTLWDAEDPKPVAELPTPMSVVYGLNFSPESHYAVAASYGELLLWDLKKLSHRVLKTVLPGNIYGATFLPPDSSTLVVANMTKGLEFWDFTKDPPVARRIVSRDLWAWDLASSPDGKRLFAPCSGGLSVLSTYSGERLAEFSGLTGPRQPGFAVDPDGNTVVWMTGSQLVTWQAPSFADIDAIEKADSDTLNARKPATRARPVSLNRTP